MPAIVKNISTEKASEDSIKNEIRSHANDPVVLKKLEKAKETLRTVGLPGQKSK